MGIGGRRYDNAMCECFFAALECERLDRRSFRHRPRRKVAVFKFIEEWYNPHRLHSALGDLSPGVREAARSERLSVGEDYKDAG